MEDPGRVMEDPGRVFGAAGGATGNPGRAYGVVLLQFGISGPRKWFLRWLGTSVNASGISGTGISGELARLVANPLMALPLACFVGIPGVIFIGALTLIVEQAYIIAECMVLGKL